MVRALAESLLLTLALESLFALIWGVRGKHNWRLLFRMNVVTNPVVVSLYLLLGGGWPLTLVLEGAAVAAEGLAWRRWGTVRPALLFSLCANGFSFCTGLLLSAWR